MSAAETIEAFADALAPRLVRRLCFCVTLLLIAMNAAGAAHAETMDPITPGRHIPAAEDPSIARMLAPTAGVALDSSSFTFTWTPGTGVTHYRLALGTSASVISAAPWADIFY